MALNDWRTRNGARSVTIKVEYASSPTAHWIAAWRLDSSLNEKLQRSGITVNPKSALNAEDDASLVLLLDELPNLAVARDEGAIHSLMQGLHVAKDRAILGDPEIRLIPGGTATVSNNGSRIRCFARYTPKDFCEDQIIDNAIASGVTVDAARDAWKQAWIARSSPDQVVVGKSMSRTGISQIIDCADWQPPKNDPVWADAYESRVASIIIACRDATRRSPTSEGTAALSAVAYPSVSLDRLPHSLLCRHPLWR